MGRKRSSKSRRWKQRRRRYLPRRKACPFCSENVKAIDYKDPSRLRQYISDGGKIEPRRKTGACAKHQRTLALAIKRARHLALLPYIPAHVEPSLRNEAIEC